VTIVAGFRCADGVVLCADTQETLAASKTHVPKLRFEPREHELVGDHKDDLVLAMAGSGNGPFIDKVVDKAWEDVQIAHSFDEACSEIEDSIKRTHQEYGLIFQTGYLPEANLIYAVKMHGQTKLFRSIGPLVSERITWAGDGTGYHLHNFFASRMYSPILPLQQLIVLAVYTIFQCKQFVDGCGGDTNVSVVNNAGESQSVPSSQVRWIEEHIRATDLFLDDILLKNADLTLSEEQLKLAYAMHLQCLSYARTEQQASKEKFDAFFKTLKGLSKPGTGTS
jgi:hypothetical protein